MSSFISIESFYLKTEQFNALSILWIGEKFMKKAFLLVLLLLGSVFAQSQSDYLSTKKTVSNVFIEKDSLESVSVAKDSSSTYYCKETDGGFDLFEEGTSIRYEGESQISSTKKDYCVDSQNLVEYWCSTDSEMNSKTFVCPDGYSCTDGSCIEESVKETDKTTTTQVSEFEATYCSDSDSMNTATKGSVESVYVKGAEKFKTESVDFCIDSSTVVEYYCAANQVGKFTKSCGEGYSCSNGACVKGIQSEKTSVSKVGETAPTFKHRIDVFSLMGERLDLSFSQFLNKPFVAKMINAKTGEVLGESTAKYTYEGQDSYNYYPNVMFAVFEIPEGVPVYFESNYDSFKFGGKQETIYDCSAHYYLRTGETVEGYVDGEVRYYLTKSDFGSYNDLLYQTSLCEGKYVTSKQIEKDYSKTESQKEIQKVDDSITSTPEIVESFDLFVLKVSKGWNLKSIPYSKVTLQKNTCADVSAYTYSTGYEKLGLDQGSTISLGSRGFWLKVADDCQMTFSVDGKSNSFDSSFNSGWAILGSGVGSVSFDDVAGSCTSSSGPWAFENGKWVRSSTLTEGLGYFVKMSSSCQMGSGSDSLPPLPN